MKNIQILGKREGIYATGPITISKPIMWLGGKCVELTTEQFQYIINILPKVAEQLFNLEKK